MEKCSDEWEEGMTRWEHTEEGVALHDGVRLP